MFDLLHYVQSGGRGLYVSLEEKSKINGENVSHDSFLSSIEVQQFFQIIMNNLTSCISHLHHPIIGI